MNMELVTDVRLTALLLCSMTRNIFLAIAFGGPQFSTLNVPRGSGWLDVVMKRLLV